jgi:hypothetical protein
MKYPEKIDSPEKLLLQVESQIISAGIAISRLLNIVDETQKKEHSSINRYDLKTLSLVARKIIDERRTRDRILNIPDLFGEPAWDILLDLFVAYVNGRPVSTSSACLSSTAPPTTGLRYLKALEGKQLIERIRHQFDARVVYVRLTDKAVKQMTYLLSQYADQKMLQRIASDVI